VIAGGAVCRSCHDAVLATAAVSWRARASTHPVQWRRYLTSTTGDRRPASPPR
jgi:hypothetical protein